VRKTCLRTADSSAGSSGRRFGAQSPQLDEPGLELARAARAPSSFRRAPSGSRPAAQFLFAARARQAGDGRGLPGSLDFDEFAVEPASNFAGQIIDRMDRPIGHVVAPGPRLYGVGPNPMAAFGARFPCHAANRTRRRAPLACCEGAESNSAGPMRRHQECGAGRRAGLSAAVSLAKAAGVKVEVALRHLETTRPAC
jgi:hypothetical protein